MTTREDSRKARQALDRRLVELKPVSRYVAPRLGWIRAIRDALGMTAADLAARMRVSGASVRSLEKKEMTGGIRLSSLRRAAEAMDCTVIYALIPNDTLQQTVETQARLILAQQRGRANQTMLLEAQDGEWVPSTPEAQIQLVIDSGRLWAQQAPEA